jgi:hypothetical protein
LRDNHYGWFDRVSRGHYDLSPKGHRELARWSDALDKLAPKSDQALARDGISTT